MKNMIVNFVHISQRWKTINGCPGPDHETSILFMLSGQRTLTNGMVIKEDTVFINYGNSTKNVCILNIARDIDNFLDQDSNLLTEQLWKFFMDYLGFVPFYGPKSSVARYVPGPEFHSVEEVRNRAKPTVYHEFMGVQVPMAIVKHMGTLTGIYESLGVYPDRIDFLPELEPHVNAALEKLNMDFISSKFTLADMLVYDFLNVLDIFNKSIFMFIDGDELLECTPQNLLGAGYFTAEERYTRLYFSYFIPKKPNMYVTDTLLEICGPRKQVSEIVNEWGELGLRAMKLELAKHRY